VKMGDARREMRACILMTLPFVPLPVQVSRLTDGNLVGDNVVVTSHDILSRLLDEACVTKDSKDHAKRKEEQIIVLNSFVMDLDCKCEAEDIGQIYSVYCDYTRRFIGTYVGNGQIPEVLFMPVDSCCRGDSTHRLVCDYMAAQCLLRELIPRDWKALDLGNILVESRRIILSADYFEGEGDEGKVEEIPSPAA
jgi:hypothetical protein